MKLPKLHTVINHDEADPTDAEINHMRNSVFNFPSTKWAAYQNMDLGHYLSGQTVFVAVGPKNTIKEPQEHAPDSALGLGWRYLFVGFVNLETGRIEKPNDSQLTETNGI